MEYTYPKMGTKVVGKVIKTKGECSLGMKVGDEFELSMHRCGDFCGYFYHSIFGWIKTLQFGGTFPLFDDPDVQVWECPNPNNRVRIVLRRVKE